MVFSIIALVIAIAALGLLISYVNYNDKRLNRLAKCHNGLVDTLASEAMQELVKSMATESTSPTCGEKAMAKVAQPVKRKRGRPAKNNKA